jgi:Fe-Mn family superoxide dismutase
MTFKLMDLPYAKDALIPQVSKETIEYHYGKHHQAYVNNLNKLIIGTDWEHETDLVNIIKAAKGGIFNNAAQIWNHNFYWQSLTSKKNIQLEGDLLTAVNKDFGSLENLKAEFIKQAIGNFGSGWTWLIKTSGGNLEILNTSNATALLTFDVWEHAYYLDYRNDRAKYLENYWQLINWDFATKNFR